MKAPPERPGDRGRPSSGFTLVELIVVLVLTAVIGGAVSLLLLRQDRFYGVNDEAIFAEQSLRATVDLFARELRGAAASDLLAAAGDSVTVRADAHRGVVCRIQGVDVSYYLYASPPANLTGALGTALAGLYHPSIAYDDGWDGSGSTASIAEREACEDRGTPDDAAPSAYRTVDWSGTSLALPIRGARIRVFAPLTYRVAPSSFSDGLAVWRDGQELAAPFSTAAFRYVLADGTDRTSVDPAALGEVERVRIELVATGAEPARFGVDRAVVFDVVLRN